MSKHIGIIVDGDGDFASLKKRFIDRYRILKTDGPRGHAAKIADIANRARKQIGILRAFQCN
jgi:5S rRNA maturation endonuclease (ribonuclease M5)